MQMAGCKLNAFAKYLDLNSLKLVFRFRATQNGCRCGKHSSLFHFELYSAAWVDNKIWVGDALPIAAEEDIFDYLGLRYLAPRERIGQVEHASMAEWSASFVENVFCKRCAQLEHST